MSDVWESFPCTIDDQAAFITFNATFAERANGSQPFQNFASFRVVLKAPRADGLPSDEEFLSLNSLEDELCKIIQPAHGAQVGRTTYGGHRDFGFHTDLSEDDCFALKDSLRNDSRHELFLLYTHDPEHTYYWQSIYPTQDDWQVIKDMRIEQALRERGDTLTAEREISHWASFPSESSRSAFIQLLRHGIQLQEIYKLTEPSEHPFIVRLSHFGRPDYRSMNRITIHLTQAARKSSGSYDGWETSLVTVA